MATLTHSPALIMNNFINMRLIDRKLFCNLSLAFSSFYQFSNLLNIVMIKLIRTTKFFRHIVHVIRVCSNKQVRRITTRRAVTFMANFFFCNWSICQFPRYSVCCHSFLINFKSSISRLLYYCSHPRPTFIRSSNFYFCPKIFSKVWTSIRSASMPFKIAGWFSLNLPYGYIGSCVRQCWTTTTTFTKFSFHNLYYDT